MKKNSKKHIHYYLAWVLLITVNYIRLIHNTLAFYSFITSSYSDISDITSNKFCNTKNITNSFFPITVSILIHEPHLPYHYYSTYWLLSNCLGITLQLLHHYYLTVVINSFYSLGLLQKGYIYCIHTSELLPITTDHYYIGSFMTSQCSHSEDKQ